MKTRFTIIGTGNRGVGCFAKGLLGFPGKGLPEFVEHAELVAMVELNVARGRAAVGELHRPDIPLFSTIAEAQLKAPADWCIVTTPDRTHCQVVIEALQAGCNVLVDKPLATSVWECDQIIAAMQRAGKQVIVGHNQRYVPTTRHAAELVRGGAIGRVLGIEAAEVLDYSHGGDYFHRWHSDFSKSAGLMTHKCCHFLDVMCWVIDDDPIEVSANGSRNYYRPRPDLNHGPRCSDCPITDVCPHFFDMNKSDGVYRRLFKDAEVEDGYVRDLCVFSDRHTINDQEAIRIKFQKGALATFTLLTFAPREFYYYYFTGTHGRLEVGVSSTDGTKFLRIIHADQRVENFPTDAGTGSGHAEADMRLIADQLGLGSSLPIQKATPAEARRPVMIADLAARSIAAGGQPMPTSAAGRDFPPAPPQL